MLTEKLLKDLVTDAFKEGFNRRFNRHTRPVVFEYNAFSGVMKVTFTLKNGNWTSVVVSLRGIDYMYKVMDRLEESFPAVCKSFHDNQLLDYEYHKDTPWFAI